MERVLIVSGSEDSRHKLAELVKRIFPASVCGASSAAEARRLCQEQVYDLLLINAPLNDEFGHELATQAAVESAAGVILIVKAELADGLAAQTEDAGVLVLAKPLNRVMLHQTLTLARATRRRLAGLHTENVKLQQKIIDIRLVDRAKLVLMEYLQMSEPQAHSFIEKQAMDRRVTKREIAEGIIRTYVN